MHSIANKLMIRMLIAPVVILAIGTGVMLHIRTSLFEDATADLMQAKEQQIADNFKLKMDTGIAALYGIVSTTPQLAELVKKRDFERLRAATQATVAEITAAERDILAKASGSRRETLALSHRAE